MNPNESLNEQLLVELRRLNANIVELIAALKQVPPPKVSKPKPAKPAPLTSDEITELQKRFESLYQLWLSGHEFEVQKELDALAVEDARRFADANNLNVTSKMSKEKVLSLIAIRFREKKMLSSNLLATKPYSETMQETAAPHESNDEALDTKARN